MIDYTSQISTIQEQFRKIKEYLNLPLIQRKVEDLSQKSNQPSFWTDNISAQNTLKELTQLQSKLDLISNISSSIEEISLFNAINVQDFSQAIANDILILINDITSKLNKFQTEAMLSGEYDNNSCIVTIHPGAGGTEAKDWASMLYRMYLRYCNKKNYTVELIDYEPGKEAGIDAVSFIVSGDYPYGHLRSENGVHRLVRMSPFNANLARQTSFAAVEVIPDYDDKIEIIVDEKDVEISTMLAGGKGGQHQNKVESAVRIKHLPTGINIACRAERSQHMNKASAWKMLKAKLYELEVKKQQEADNQYQKSKSAINFGSQIRNYFLAPNKLVKDARTGFETTDTESVLDGNIDGFIESFLLQ